MSQTSARAIMKTGIASSWAGFTGPPRTNSALATTRLPVMCAVKILPSMKNPVRSTMPAMTLSTGGNWSSIRSKAACSSDGATELFTTSEFRADMSIFNSFERASTPNGRSPFLAR
jgi:hypothetical protein